MNKSNLPEERAAQVVALYQKQLIHDDPADLLVDILVELRALARRRRWDFAAALQRSRKG